MRSPLVSILIPVYNREKLVKEAIESAINQTYKNIEIIVVDNKSTDNTWEILKEYTSKDKRIKIYQNESNIGPVLNWKRCIELARGEYSKILWSDDLIADTFIEKTLPYLIKYQDVGFTYTPAYIFNDKTKVLTYLLGASGIYKSSVFIKGILLQEKSVPVSPGCAIFRTEDLKRGLVVDIPNKFSFNHRELAIGNDLLIYLITAYRYPKFAFVEEPLAFFRYHEDSITVHENREKLLLGYDLAKTYFIENYLCTNKNLWLSTIKKFNTLAWFHVLRLRLSKSEFKIKNIKDLYCNNTDSAIDLGFFMKTIPIISYRFLKKVMREKILRINNK